MQLIHVNRRMGESCCAAFIVFQDFSSRIGKNNWVKLKFAVVFHIKFAPLTLLVYIGPENDVHFLNNILGMDFCHH